MNYIKATGKAVLGCCGSTRTAMWPAPAQQEILELDITFEHSEAFVLIRELYTF